jgi:hypothetical protein
VLVDVPEYVEKVDRDRSWISLPTVARLMLRDYRDASLAQADQLAGPFLGPQEVSAEFLPPQADGEAGVPSLHSAIPLHGLPHEVVETRSKVVDDLPKPDAPSHLKLARAKEPNVFPGFRITLTREGCLIEVKERQYRVDQLVCLLSRTL